ncbi:MAG TPA: response regulator, partial [bacterium]|nr:response regulator [bacterium]
MKAKIRFKSIKSRLTFWFLMVALLPLIAVSIIISQQRVRVIKENAFHKLTAIRDLKVNEVNNWIDERLGDIKVISGDLEVRAAGKVFDKQEYTETGIHILQAATKLLNRYVDMYEAYEEIFIINSRSQKTELSTNNTLIGLNKSQDPNFTEPMRTGDVYIKDIYYSKTIRRLSMTFSIPIYAEGESKHIAGILVARIDLEPSLYDLLMDRTGMGNTGETLIVNKDGMALNELRWHRNAPLKLKIETKPALMASQGKSGIAETGDYRGEEVLAAYTYIPRTQWGFVAKQDLKEVYASVQKMFLNIAIICLISAAMVCLLAFFVVKNIALPVRKMTEVSKKIQEGDLAARNHIMSEDELGFLARSINNMADSIGSQLLVQGNVADLNKTMVAFRGLRDFAGELLKKLIETTGSNMGAFHLLTDDGTRFEHFTSVGVSPELLEPFDATGYEGELGRAVAVKEISHIKDIPEETIFKFKTFAGTALPKEIVTIPLVIDGTAMGVISLASLQIYSNESLDVLNQIRQGISMAFSNLLVGEKTEKLAGELQQKNEQLEAQAEELQSQAEELQQTSDELQEQNIELETQQHQVEDANRLKSEFLSNMSHELRTPLNSVMALSRVLLMQSKDKLSEEEAGYLEIIERNGKRLLSLINDILDLSKIEAGKMDLNPRRFSLAGTIEVIIESLDPISDDKGIEMIQDLPPDLPEIETDEERVHQILQNLIGNAIKFTDKGSVSVSAQYDETNFSIRVQDTGIGISEEDLTNIFEEFRQVDGSTARQYEGTGLGLAIAKKATTILGGTLSVTSTLGKGSSFILTLPILWKGEAPEYEPLTYGVSRKILPEQKTILVVDDEPEVATMISGFLSTKGYNVIAATSGKEALGLAKSEHPFAITLDIFMPDMDGWEVLQELKQDPDTAHIPVIVVSVTDDKQTGFALGAVGYITKPVNRDALIAEINKVGQKTGNHCGHFRLIIYHQDGLL